MGASEEVTLTLRSHMRARRAGDDMQLALTPPTATASLVVHYPALSEIARRVRRWRGHRVRMRLEVVRAVDALGVADRRLEVRELEALEPPQPPAASANATPAPHEQPTLRVTVLTPEGHTITIEGVRPGVPRARDGYTVTVEPE
ncbi:MAG: hypothetical protein D6776_07810 [Planctomycetota bacterium]|nr:MAG: hypothetical protein D6776_07810 [Planctomycetota bacterium]